MSENAEKAKNVIEALSTIRKELLKELYKKSGKNSSYNYEYFELKDFIPAVVKLEQKHNIFSLFQVDPIQGLAILRIFFDGEEKLSVSTKLVLSKMSSEIQSLGATHTYLKRYLYMDLYNIVENDKVEPETGKKESEKKKVIIEVESQKVLETPSEFVSEEKKSKAKGAALRGKRVKISKVLLQNGIADMEDQKRFVEDQLGELGETEVTEENADNLLRRIQSYFEKMKRREEVPEAVLEAEELFAQEELQHAETILAMGD